MNNQSNQDDIYLEMEDVTKLKLMFKTKESNDSCDESTTIHPGDSYQFDMDLNAPHCFENYDRYLNYHLIGFDPHNIPFFRKHFKLNDT